MHARGGPHPPLACAWEHTVGSGRALLALRAEWREHLRRASFDLGFRHVRFHGMLDDDMGTLVSQNERLLHSFFNIDSIFDYLLSIGMQPFAELSFMPATLASGDTTVFRYRGNVTPPRDYQQWGAFYVCQLPHHGEPLRGCDVIVRLVAQPATLRDRPGNVLKSIAYLFQIPSNSFLDILMLSR